ncbi:MAG: hypothetical protein HXY19_00910 [Thermoanaerobaculaceae bacterium]|nr:hypothetical protein [Thermoanaerobaculaceae bacterium]
MRSWIFCLLLVPALVGAESSPGVDAVGYVGELIAAHPEWDAAYTAAIRDASTDGQFLTDLVDHLPASPSVPTPLAINGVIAGGAGHLTSSAGVAAYMRAVAAASPRVRVFSLGSSEEGREMILVAVADEATIASLDEYRAITAALSDPRTISEDQARRLIARGKPIYYLTGGLHSPETGSPEMLMELVYRLAVEETPLIRSIRENVITLVTPVLEVDGRDRMVDLFHYAQAHPEVATPPLVYWGHYVAHDNNRDAIGMALALTRHVEQALATWHPQVMHDLHESIPFLYISSGTGPYNAWLDPLVVDEWERMAIREVQELTAKGLPGVWTHGFYDGWAPGYLFWLALGRNAVGRFYETFGNVMPSTEERIVGSESQRAWFRPNPPLPRVRWSLRNNVNYQQSGVLLALSHVAAQRQRYLEQYWQLGRRAVAKARREGPAAYVLPAGQKRQGQLRDLLALLERHGIEVYRALEAFQVPLPAAPAPRPGSKGDTRESGGSAPVPTSPGRRSFPPGSYIVRMDQPLSRLADAFLDTQYVRSEERLYDDAGWTVGLARNLEVWRVTAVEVLDVPMERWSPALTRRALALSPRAGALLVRHHADTDLVRLRTAVPQLVMLVAEQPFVAGEAYAAGTVIVPLAGVDRSALAETLAGLDLPVTAVPSVPSVPTHPFLVPRVALLHTWFSTQDEGWFRLALEELGIPYESVATSEVAALGELRQRYDVILMPPFGAARSQDVVNGYPDGPPLPWRRTELTPNLGVHETDDMRPGLGFAGLASLQAFVRAGGVFLAVGSAARFAVEMGLARYVRLADTEGVKVAGSLLRATVRDATSPVAYGYDSTLPVYVDAGPVFTVGTVPSAEREERRPSGRGSSSDPDVPQGRPFLPPPEPPVLDPLDEGFIRPEGLPFRTLPYLPQRKDRPRVILEFPKGEGDLLLSGLLEGGKVLAGKALVVDCPLGSGHVLLFGNNPMWRHNTQGSWALVTNAILQAAHLGVGWPPPPPSVAP